MNKDKKTEEPQDNKENKDKDGNYQVEDAPKNHPDNTTGNMKIIYEG